MNTVRWGIIGCGDISDSYFLGAARSQLIRLKACADLRAEAAEAKAAEHGCEALGVDALLADPEINTYAAFESARQRNVVKRTLWVLFGPFSGGPRRRGLPRSLEWLIDVPTVAQSVT